MFYSLNGKYWLLTCVFPVIRSVSIIASFTKRFGFYLKIEATFGSFAKMTHLIKRRCNLSRTAKSRKPWGRSICAGPIWQRRRLGAKILRLKTYSTSMAHSCLLPWRHHHFCNQENHILVINYSLAFIY